MSKKTVLIWGATGQIASYLVEMYLEKDYKVYGIKRRSSTNTLWRVQHLLNNPDLELIEGDITDPSSVNNLTNILKPDLCINTAAQSHVGTSFEQPAYTFNVNANGVLYILESIKNCSPQTKFLQFSTSEMMGDNYSIDENGEKYQDESTQFSPVSQYAVSKLAAYHLVKLYRKAYHIFSCNNINFNSESIPGHIPVLLRKDNGFIDILPIEDMFRTEKHKYEGILDCYKNMDIWDGESWTKIIDGTCYQDKTKQVNVIQSVSRVLETTLEHSIFMNGNIEKESKDIIVGDLLYEINYPFLTPLSSFLDNDIAKFIGFVVGDGYVSEEGKTRVIGTDKKLLLEMSLPFINKFGFTYRLYNNGPGSFNKKGKDIWHLDINCDRNLGKWLRKNIYTLRSGKKRVPDFILNSNNEIQKSFFDGYYLADGRKAGHERYQYKGFSTNSATLCLGLIIIINNVLRQDAKVKYNIRDNNLIYHVQLRSPDSHKNKYNKKNLYEVIKIFNVPNKNNWFFDLQTISQCFAVGPHLAKIHNSPRRGEEFVTRKITQWIAKFKKCKDQDITALTTVSADNIIFTNGYNEDRIFPKLRLGNITAYRDWSHAKDVCRGVYLALNYHKPDDYVFGSGQTQTVADFCKEAFKCIWIDNWEDYIIIDPKFYRPAEVDYLKSRPTKAKEVLGWETTISFQDLVKEMVEADIARENEKTA